MREPLWRSTHPDRDAQAQGRAEEAQVLESRAHLGQDASSATAPGSSRSSSTELAGLYGRPAWERRLDPTSELILTILTQNSADTTPRSRSRRCASRYPGGGEPQPHNPGAGLGRRRAARRGRARLGRGRVRAAPRTGRDDPAGRPGQPEGAADPGDAPPDPRGTRRLLARVPRRDDRPRRARLADHDRRHRQEDRVRPAAVLVRAAAACRSTATSSGSRCASACSPPKASADDAHDLFLGMLEPDQMYEAHVNLIQHGRKVCHAQRPDHDACPLRARCRFVDPKAP